ncbi:MAG TPA: endonuclease domain-containing protein [Allosphingosinicella sp.]|jgi:very-short-patch-repair endonuclease
MGVVRRTISRHAAPLRQNCTRAEQALWFELRARRLGGHKFRRQWSLGAYIVDFCCVERGLVVEVDGGQHDEARDAERTRALKEMGFRVIRFWNNDMLGNPEGVLEVILETLGGPLPSEDPCPSPLPQAGEGM